MHHTTTPYQVRNKDPQGRCHQGREERYHRHLRKARTNSRWPAVACDHGNKEVQGAQEDAWWGGGWGGGCRGSRSSSGRSSSCVGEEGGQEKEERHHDGNRRGWACRDPKSKEGQGDEVEQHKRVSLSDFVSDFFFRIFFFFFFFGIT